MDTEAGQADNGRDVIDESPAYTLAGTDEGWGVWDRTDPSGRPAVFYPPTESGFVLAAAYYERANGAVAVRRGPWLDISRNVAFVAGGVWIAASIIDSVRYATEDDRFSDTAIRWVIAISGISYSIFLVAIAVYVLLWLRGHQRP